MEGTPPMSLFEDETGVKLIIIIKLIIIKSFANFVRNDLYVFTTLV